MPTVEMNKITKSDIRKQFNEFIKEDMFNCEVCRKEFYDFMVKVMCMEQCKITYIKAMDSGHLETMVI